MNLVEIIGRVDNDGDWLGEENYGATRVVDLEVIGGKLRIIEGCDEYFSIELTRLETQRLIDWLRKTITDLREGKPK